MNIEKRRWSLSKLSLGCFLLVVLYIIIFTLKEIFFPTSFDSSSFKSFSFFKLNLLLAINLIGFILGLVSVVREKENKKMAYTSIILNAIFPIGVIISVFSALNR